MQLLETGQTYVSRRLTAGRGVEKRMLFLDPLDRRLIELILSGRVTRREAGARVGRATGTMTRRIRALLRRLNDPLVVALAEDGALLPEYHQAVGLAFFLRREPMERIAREFGLTRYGVKRMIDQVRGWHAARRERR